jgi:hypothetical protein
MILQQQQNVTDRGTPNTWMKTRSCTILSTINPTRTGLGSNQAFRVVRPAVSQHSDVTAHSQREAGEITRAFLQNLQWNCARCCGQNARVHRTVRWSESPSWNPCWLQEVAFSSTVATVLVAMNASNVSSVNIYVCVTSNPKQPNLLFHVQSANCCDLTETSTEPVDSSLLVVYYV